MGILEGKKGIIFGALNDKSIAWKAAEAAVREGASIVLTNTAMAMRFGTVNELAEKCNAPVIVADATNVEDLSNLVDGAMEHFGGKFDFVLHSVGMSPNIRKNVPYEELNYDFLSKTLDISAISFHKLIKVLYAKDALNDAGSIVALTYRYGRRQGPSAVDNPQLRQYLRKTQWSENQYRIPVSNYDFGRPGNSRNGQDVRVRRQAFSSGQC